MSVVYLDACTIIYLDEGAARAADGAYSAPQITVRGSLSESVAPHP